MLFQRVFSILTIAAILSLAGVTACSSSVETPTPSTALATGTHTQPVPTFMPTITATATPRPLTATPDIDAPVCSPLEGIALNDLSKILSNPLATPHPGLDDGHHGIDLAFYRYGERTTMRGLPVYSVLPGVVASVVNNRPPYGNMVLIETPLEMLSPRQIQRLDLPEIEPTQQPGPAMVCPTLNAKIPVNSQRSLYFLYAHMESKPAIQVGESVSCGTKLGGVGTTGMSVNEHLHLEARIGPAGEHFEGMAFYDTGASSEEMANYCRWRASQTFQLLDPLETLLTLENY